MKRPIFVLLLVLLLGVQVAQAAPVPPGDATPTITEASFDLYSNNTGVIRFCYHGGFAVVQLDKILEGYGNAWQYSSIINDGGCFRFPFPPYPSNNDYTVHPSFDFDKFYITVHGQETGQSTTFGPYRWRRVHRVYLGLLRAGSSVAATPRQLRYIPALYR